MSGKTKGSGLAARMATVPPVSAVAAGFAAATGTEPPTPDAKPGLEAKEVVALNIRLPKDLHGILRERVFHSPEKTSINAMLIEAAHEWLDRRR